MILPTIDITNQSFSDEKLSNLIKSLNLIGEIILRVPNVSETSALSKFLESFPLDRYWIFPIQDVGSNDIEDIIHLLDMGAQKVVIPSSQILAGGNISELPADRIIANLNSRDISSTNVEELIENLSISSSGYLVTISNDETVSKVVRSIPEKLLKDFSNFTRIAQNKILSSGGVSKVGLILHPENFYISSLEFVKQLSEFSAELVVSIDQLTLDENVNGLLNIADAFNCSLKSDRPDGLIVTVVVDEGGVAMGVVYSSTESVREALKTRKGVYQSRKRGLWYKGATSGSVQELKAIQVDCDGDSLRFVVKQHGTGFCHLNTRTCFGADHGLTALEGTLQSRKVSSPPESYTQRLFQNPDLLRSKIMEEADELCSASTKEEIAWETADLFYFALVKCIANGVSLADVELQLDQRAKKITRRPGNAKPKWDESIKSSNEKESPPPKTDYMVPTIMTSKEEFIKMQKFSLFEISRAQRISLLQRPIIKSDDIIAKVRPIIEDVRKRGDAALIEYTAKFDGVQLKEPVISAPFLPESMELDEATRHAIDQAFDNIYKFHDAQYDRSTLVIETMPGVTCSRFSRPIERVGLYVPGGTAILPSTALMLGIPAKVAGCKEIVIASPPRKDGTVVPEVMYVAHKVGASKVVLAGGAQAIAALAYGTDTVPKVDKICGPGNQYVTAAKMLAQNDSSAMVSIDMPAGPSELLVIADNTSIPAYVASDLLSQAEHGTDSQVVLVGVSLTSEHLSNIEREIHEQASCLPRVDIVRESIPKSFILEVSNMDEAIKFANDYAPEHLILHIEDAESLVEKVQNAGSVFVGAYSPESCGDYASGTNHTLPTYGYARMYSGVNTLTFLKHITAQKLTKEGLKNLGHVVMRLAEIEELEAHRNAVHVRIRDLENE
ncbi:979_t:CDS:2 [Acaulospora morrowiae]|uniref:Histidine biosynthesis trifunctional protein n=1 Tax=Acaulospora morrowiae TaxID=94023 RepID=A0A9N9FKY0_9GLOM|nr:979_t:CDS:2 [Acaulospora morrowiae]